jgi:hypothetical protein
VRELGFVACRHLQAGKAGRVTAAFERSVYVDFAGGFVCFAEAGSGPLNGVLEEAAGRGRIGRLVGVGDPAAADAAGVHIGGRLFLSTERAATWRPPPPPRWTPRSLARGLGGLESAVRGRRAGDGLGVFAGGRAAARSRAARAAAAPVALLREWLVAAVRGEAVSAPPPVSALVGLGPGLTPAGDDFLGGAMIALHLVRAPEPAARLYGAIAAEATDGISLAHLAAAAEGAGCAALHAALDGVLAGDLAEMPARAAALGRIGHTSGWDALAGAAVALRAWLRAGGAAEGI